MDLTAVVDALVSLGAFLGSLGLSGGVIWAFFRKRLAAWWDPYKTGLQGAAQVPKLAKDVEQVTAAMSLLTMHVRVSGDIAMEAAQFETGPDGANTYVNQTFARMLGVGKAELMGWGWINFVHPDDRIHVRQEWDACRREHRKYSIRFRFLDAGGEEIPVDVLAMPIPESPPAKQWLGVIRRVV